MAKKSHKNTPSSNPPKTPNKPKKPKLIGDDLTTKWYSLGEEWSSFVTFWKDPTRDNGLKHEYPYQLDLKLPSALKSHLTPLVDLRTHLLVTQSYADLYDRIKLGLRLDSPDGMKYNPSQKGVVITGQPGTGTLSIFQLTTAHFSVGKSVCLLYIAVRLLHDYPSEPLFFVQPNLALLIYQNLVYGLPKSRKFESSLQLPSGIFPSRASGSSCLTLVEWGKTASPPNCLSWPLLLPIFASSPDVKRTEDFALVKDPFMWGMPTWTLLELSKG